jgi:hypothetical protein
MDATPFDFAMVRPLAGFRNAMEIRSLPKRTGHRSTLVWQAIHEAASLIGSIAGIEEMAATAEVARGAVWGATAEATGDPGIEDLADVLQRGIDALLTAHLEGGVPQAAATALWHEFIRARDNLLNTHIHGGATQART